MNSFNKQRIAKMPSSSEQKIAKKPSSSEQKIAKMPSSSEQKIAKMNTLNKPKIVKMNSSLKQETAKVNSPNTQKIPKMNSSNDQQTAKINVPNQQKTAEMNSLPMEIDMDASLVDKMRIIDDLTLKLMEKLQNQQETMENLVQGELKQKNDDQEQAHHILNKCIKNLKKIINQNLDIELDDGWDETKDVKQKRLVCAVKPMMSEAGAANSMNRSRNTVNLVPLGNGLNNHLLNPDFANLAINVNAGIDPTQEELIYDSVTMPGRPVLALQRGDVIRIDPMEHRLRIYRQNRRMPQEDPSIAE